MPIVTTPTVALRVLTALRRRGRLVLIGSVLLAGSADAARYAVLDPPASKTVPEASAQAIADVAAGAISRAGHDVVTRQQIEAVVGLEATRELAGCDAGACAAELASALGADGLITLRITRLGSSLIVAVKRIDMAGQAGAPPTAKVADTRLKTSRLDAVVDVVPGLIGEVLANAAPTPSPGTATGAPSASIGGAGQAPTPLASGGFVRDAKAPGAWRDIPPTSTLEERRNLRYLKGEHGAWLAYNPEAPYSGPMYYGVGGTLYEQRLIGGGKSGDTQFSAVFWDPRFSSGGERELVLKEGRYFVQCGSEERPLIPVKTPPKVKLLGPRWQRQLVHVGRDDDLTWYIVDKARDDDDGKKPDFHLYVGRTGAFVPVVAEIVADPTYGNGILAVAAGGSRVKIGPGGGERIVGGVSTPLTVLELYGAAADVYGAMMPWGKPGLGTPCDTP